MAELTKDYQTINSSNKRFTYGGVTYDYTFYIDAKYSQTETQRLNKKSSIYTRLRVIKNSTGRVYSDARPSFSLSYAPTKTATSRWYYDTETITETASTGYEVSHDSNGYFSATLTATISDSSWGSLSHSFNASVSIPRIILEPTLSISGAGSSKSNRVQMSTSNVNVSVTVGNVPSGETPTFKLDGASVTYSSGKVTIPISIWSNIANTDEYDGTLTVTTTGGSKSATVYCKLADSVKPTVSSVVLSATNSASTLGTNAVKGISKHRIVTTATAPSGTNIKKYELISLTGIDGLPKVISETYNGERTFNAPSVVATVRVWDGRNHYTDKTSNTVSVVDYSLPSFTSCYVKRCTSSGVLDENGTYGKLFIDYVISPIHIGSADKNTKSLSYSLNGTNWTPISISSYSGHQEKTIGTGTFVVTDTYDVWVKLSDITGEAGSTTTKLQIVPSFTTVSLHSGGKGVSVGRIATADELQIYMQTHINNGLYIGNTLVLYDDGN